MATVATSARGFLKLGLNLKGVRFRKSSQRRNKRRFISIFGTEPCICSIIWEMLTLTKWTAHTNKPKPVHLLWALRLLKSYSTEADLAAEVGGKDEKTFRKWAWFYIEGVANLAEKVVSKIRSYYSDIYMLYCKYLNLFYCFSDSS